MMTKTQLQWLVVLLQRQSSWSLELVHSYIQQKLRKLMICSIITIINYITINYPPDKVCNILMNSINYKKYCCCSSHLVCILYDPYSMVVMFSRSVLLHIFSIVVFFRAGSTFLRFFPHSIV